MRRQWARKVSARRFRPVVDPKVRALTTSRRVRGHLRLDTALEAFRRNPTDGSLAPTPARASAEPNVRTCLFVWFVWENPTTCKPFYSKRNARHF
ncbi:Uncharacterized protein FWK35_00017453 [Aphis craccivora]|uniref:Uncharacterized protein n=1 Tax=Aphis craccivora TaxID=307492 RepID=A0A6G0Y3R5_APHCR|nr:Uncharacterized protein FWK35_00017453 [Aphis craccivora]